MSTLYSHPWGDTLNMKVAASVCALIHLFMNVLEFSKVSYEHALLLGLATMLKYSVFFFL